MTTCFQRRVYAARPTGGLLRFRDRQTFDEWRISAGETRRSLKIITRSEFQQRKVTYEDPRWVRSVVMPGMDLLVEGEGER